MSFIQVLNSVSNINNEQNTIKENWDLFDQNWHLKWIYDEINVWKTAY